MCASVVSAMQRLLFLKVQFCSNNFSHWLLSVLLNDVKLFCVICASLTFFFLIVFGSFFPVLLTWFIFSFRVFLRVTVTKKVIKGSFYPLMNINPLTMFNRVGISPQTEETVMLFPPIYSPTLFLFFKSIDGNCM